MYTLGCLKYVSKVNRKETEKEVKFIKVTSIEELTKMIAKDKNLEEEIKKDPIEEIARITESPFQTEKWIYLIVVLILGLTVLIISSGVIYLTATNNGKVDIPEILVAIGSAAVGALAGLLAPTLKRE